MIICPIHAANFPDLRKLAARAREQYATALEVRLDLCVQDGAQLGELIPRLSELPLPVIATLRHASEGGAWHGDEHERLTWLVAADQAGVAYVDVELATAADLPQRLHHAQLMLSFHDFHGMAGDLSSVVERMFAAGAAIAKIAVTPRDAADLATIEQLYRHCESGSLIAIAMGEIGLPSRLLAGAWGSAGTFGRLLEDSTGSAPGQPTCRDLHKLYRVTQQGPETRIFGVLGNPISHSLSPLIHNTGFAHLGVDAVYVPFLAQDALAFWQACKGWIDGLSITIPHKTALFAAVDGIEELAERIGAINTVYRDHAGRAIGANTDADAALACIRNQVGNLAGARVLMLGAGGVSRAIALALHAEGARVTIANRTTARAESLALEVGCAAVAWEDAPRVDYQVLVNGTSVGMRSDESPWPMDQHRPGTAVFDTVYTPLETRLLREAQSQGCTPICGLSMFSLQAIGQFERWTGMAAPSHAMHRTALEALGHQPDHMQSDLLKKA